MPHTPATPDAQPEPAPDAVAAPEAPVDRPDPGTQVDPAADQERLDRATADLDPPFAVVDLAAFRRNAEDLRRRAAGTPIRVASKSVRCRDLLGRVLDEPGFRGVMAYSLPEALWLHREGLSEDILVAYPTVDRQALRELAAVPAAHRPGPPAGGCAHAHATVGPTRS